MIVAGRVFAVACGAAFALAACAPVQVRTPSGTPGTAAELAAQAARERRVAAEQDWGIAGRFAASDRQHGGSGSLSWRQRGAQFEFVLRAPITGRSVELDGGPGGVVLKGVGREPVAGSDAQDVLRKEFGWEVPVADLAFWVRGLRAPGRSAILTFGANGLPATLDQDGWRVDYPEWYAERVPALPRKVYASRPPYNVRVFIEQWTGPR